MNAEQIMQVLRQTAMGRINTPDQQELCEKLAEMLALVPPTKHRLAFEEAKERAEALSALGVPTVKRRKKAD